MNVYSGFILGDVTPCTLINRLITCVVALTVLGKMIWTTTSYGMNTITHRDGVRVKSKLPKDNHIGGIMFRKILFWISRSGKFRILNRKKDGFYNYYQLQEKVRFLPIWLRCEYCNHNNIEACKYRMQSIITYRKKETVEVVHKQ